jgi:uncharacterized protein YqhQ
VPRGTARFLGQDSVNLISKQQTSENGGDRKSLSSELAMGGQAVVEGVMMRGPERIAVAVREPNGNIAMHSFPYTPISRKHTSLKLPIIRGAVGLFESMKIGISALEWSAGIASGAEVDESGKSRKLADRLGLGLSFLVATVLALGLFVYVPLWLGKLVAGLTTYGPATRQLVVNAVAGGIRIIVLLLYLGAISWWKEIRRVFQYHGAEHKTIFAFEKHEPLTPDIVVKQSRFHPRCGTSFLLIVAVSAILFFMIVDSLIVAIFGEYPSTLARFLVHVPLIPVVAGISYEFLKFSAKRTENRLVRILIQPGLWLQRITTKEPDPGMCEVAIYALKHALGEDPATMTVPAAEPVEATATP